VNDGFLYVVTLPCSSEIFNFWSRIWWKEEIFLGLFIIGTPIIFWENNIIQCYRMQRWWCWFQSPTRMYPVSDTCHAFHR